MQSRYLKTLFRFNFSKARIESVSKSVFSQSRLKSSLVGMKRLTVKTGWNEAIAAVPRKAILGYFRYFLVLEPGDKVRQHLYVNALLLL
jgi:hypothetical protein